MFDTFIPSAWAALLPILLTQDNLVSIFEAWPPSRTPVSGGDTMYWNDLPRKVLSAITRDKLEVWPVITSGSPGLVNPKFADLGSLLVASEADDHETLTAFALAGVSITQPPSWVMSLLIDAKVDFVLLTPLTARQALLVSCRPVSPCLSLMYRVQTIEQSPSTGCTALKISRSRSYSDISSFYDGSNAHCWITSYSSRGWNVYCAREA
jgi:hypothetical protein